MRSDDDLPGDPDATHAPRSRVPADAPTRPRAGPALGGAVTLPAANVGVVGELTVGALIAERYQIIRFIARGGMGEVYEVDDLELGQRVALKTLRPERAQVPRELERLKREIVLARGVTHPGICRLFDVGFHTTDDASIAFLTMELLDGPTLAEELRRAGPWSPAEARAALGHLAAALGAAHAVGVIHRDFKSQNIILVERGGARVPVITDFGLAARDADPTVTDRFAGTPAYMAPEQVLGLAPTFAADVYALGVVAYELISGHLPFEGASGLALAVAKTRTAAPSVRSVAPAVDDRWARALARALEREPARRWPTPAAFVAALDGARPRPRRWWLVAGLAAIAAVGAIAVPWSRTPAPVAPAPVPPAPIAPLRDAAGRLALQLGGEGQDIVEGVRIDRRGDLIVVGHCSAPFTFHGATITPPVSGAQVGFVIDVAPDGRVRWTRVLGGKVDAMTTTVAVTDDDDVIVGGTFKGAIDLGTGATLTPAGRSDGFVLRLAGADGATRWLWRTEASGAGQARGLTVTHDAVFVAGDAAGGARFGTDRAVTPATDRSGPFVARLGLADGRPAWIHAPGGTGDGRYWRTAVGDGGVFAVGFFFGELAAGAPRPTASKGDALVTRLDAATGAVQWVRSFGGDQFDELYAIAFADGRLAVTGETTGPGTWGGTAIASGGSADLLVAELAPADGALRWVRGFPAKDYQQGRAVGFAPDGRIHVAARMSGALELAAPDAPIALRFEEEDTALVTFDRAGRVVGARRWAGGGSTRPRDMVVAADGRVTIAGQFREVVFDDGRRVRAAGTSDGFVLDVAP
jgi:uncharacterized protein YfiM (DUF2279 family)